MVLVHWGREIRVAIKTRQIKCIWTLDSDWDHRAFYQSTQYCMVVRFKACATVAGGGGGRRFKSSAWNPRWHTTSRDEGVTGCYWSAAKHWELYIVQVGVCFPDGVSSIYAFRWSWSSRRRECADLMKIWKKYFEEKSLYSLFRNVIPEVVLDFLRVIGVFYRIWSVLR